MFQVKVGGITFDVECVLLEEMAVKVDALSDDMEVLLDELLTDGPETSPAIKFTIGPVSEQKE
jgi:hypothetical protein